MNFLAQYQHLNNYHLDQAYVLNLIYMLKVRHLLFCVFPIFLVQEQDKLCYYYALTAPAALPAKTALPHPIRTRTIVPIISAKYFFMIVLLNIDFCKNKYKR